MVQQGWHPDPFEVHRFRFFRDGKPTGLVMDNGAETYDEPPEAKTDVSIMAEAVVSTESNPSFTSPAGWYNDPLGEGLRYWDGATWSNIAVQSMVEVEALCHLSRLVNDGGDDPHDEPRQPEVQLPERAPTPLSPPSDWWQASDGKWYPPEQHPNYLATHGAATHLPTSGTPPVRQSASREGVKTAQPVPSDEWNRHDEPVPPPCPERPFYRDPWFWAAVAAVIVCPMRRRSHR
jgi:hypothetical protein